MLCVFNFAAAGLLLVEVQFHLPEILELKAFSHFPYKFLRADASTLDTLHDSIFEFNIGPGASDYGGRATRTMNTLSTIKMIVN